MKKILAIALALALVLGCLAGCQGQQSKPEPKTPEELGKLVSEAMKDADNVRADMEMTADIQIKAQTTVEGMSLNMEIGLPIELSMKLAIAGDQQHATMDMSMNASVKVSADGQSQTQEEKVSAAADMYMVRDGKTTTSYTKTWDQDSSEADAKWVKSTIDGDELSKITDMFSDVDIWKLATMEKVDGDYTLSFKLADLLKDEDIRKALEENDVLDLGDLDFEQVIEVLGDATLTATVDGESYQQKSAALTNFTVGKALEDMIKELCNSLAGVEFDDLDITFDMDWTFQFSDYGKVTEQEVQVPDDVAAQAVEDDSGDAPSIDIPWGAGSDDPGTDLPDPAPVATDPIDPGVSAGTLTGEMLMDIQLDGTALSFPADLEALKALGWTLETDEYGSFYVMASSKYPDCDFYVSLMDPHGFNSLDVGTWGNAAHPDFSIAGIKLGLTYKDVYAIAGEPDGTYASEDYFSVDYEVEINGVEYDLCVTMIAPESAGGYDYENAVVIELELTCYE